MLGNISLLIDVFANTMMFHEPLKRCALPILKMFFVYPLRLSQICIWPISFTNNCPKLILTTCQVTKL